MTPASVNGTVFAQAVAYARHRPGTVLAWLLGLHVAVWTLLPIPWSPNLQLDLLEGLALGREWQLGYWKHPPLPWWITDLVYRVTGLIHSVYVLGPLSAALCLYGVWLLGRDTVGGFKALIAVIALEGIHYYNFSVVKFAHNQMQLPFWAFAGWFFWRAIGRGRMPDWALAGACLAGAFWSKYAVFALAVTLGLVLLLDPVARRAWRTPGPYVMAAAFAILVAPNVWWLVTHDFLPLTYVDDRAIAATRWYHYLVFPLRWIGGQVAALAPAMALLAFLYLPRRRTAAADADTAGAFDRRYLLALAIGPFLVTTVIAAATGRQPVAMWGYPMWSFAPLAVLVLLPPALDATRLRRFAAAALAMLIAVPVVFAAIEVGESLWQDRVKAAQFPGRLLAETITRRWRERTGTPLAYVGGAKVYAVRDGIRRELPGPGEFAANNVAVYSPDRPHVIVKGDVGFSPWIDAGDLDRRGAVLIWQPADEAFPENLKQAFPHAELQPPLTLPRQRSFARAPRSPIVVHYALVPPRP